MLITILYIYQNNQKTLNKIFAFYEKNKLFDNFPYDAIERFFKCTV